MTTDTAPTGANSRFCYLYRDEHNYKQSAEVVFAGRPTPEQEEQLRSSLDEDLWFIAEQVRIAPLQDRFGKITEADHVWHEFGGLEATDAAPTDPHGRTVVQLIDEFGAVGT